ncbi:putative aromatic hydrocarbon degradation protein/Long-chain fatty acid transport protein [Vibrio nigripulchritudo MADA3029]|nr:putative aromatic hydrocarbon degradation protein/Long-chain fatty acid transport protein [Vibrio nigripulchritudo MADA3020]CCN52784.1 putative aromatic hydrocarbon degradation protein/Long-chain fatty acid transport protein [Vibrio nigripulchritudo MADA3021]CCN57725.1 putative aromatic hydrocarbon degradation protein/Long-chain fatty acid transport protein [Vibrio nigripulchritudo MADA3029]
MYSSKQLTWKKNNKVNPMKNSRLFKKTVIATTIALASQQAIAAGFQLNAQSATGLGRAFAGDAVIADNASVMARNAAAMSLFESSQFSGGINVINTEIKVTDVKAGGLVATQDSAKNTSSTPVPNIYYIHRLSDKIALGAGIYSNFGTKNNFDDTFGKTSGLSVFGGNTEIKSVNYALAASYRVNEQLSLGAGLDIVQGSGIMKRDTSGNLLDLDVSGTGYGFNVGAVYELDAQNRFGLAYHYSPEIKASGTIKLQTVKDLSNEDLLLPLPSMLEFSGYHELNNTDFAVHYSVQWIGWKAFDKIETSEGSFSKDYKWKDGYHFSLGGTYFLSEALTLRAGYMYDTAAQDELTSISVPDSNRHWLSAGASYSFAEKHTVDVGFTYLMGQDVAVTEYKTPTSVAMTATTHANAILAGVQYSYSF